MAWLTEFRSHPAWDAVSWVVLALLALVLRQLAHRSRLADRLDAGLSLIAFGILVGGFAILVRLAGFADETPYFDAVILTALAIGGVRVTLTLFVDLYLRQSGNAAVSAIVRDIASIVAYFVVIVVVLRTTLDINVASLIATSAVLTAIIGLALQDLLGNLFSGLVIEMEAPFRHGDWVRVGAFEGTVEETGWRTTKLRTRVNEIVTLPNAMLSREPVVNFSRPDPLHGDTLRFEAGQETPPNVVKNAVMAVFSEELQVERFPLPEVRVERYTDDGIGYAVRYWIRDYGDLEHIRNRLHTNLWYALHRSEIRIPNPVREVFVHRGTRTAVATPVDVTQVLRSVPLLEPLDDRALQTLAGHARRYLFGVGEIIVRAGDAGDSFYVIERGTAEVLLKDSSRPAVLNHLQAGSFFGEMSLLAGEPRSATVRATSDLEVVVVDRDAFKNIIAADPALLGPLSDIAAERLASQQELARRAGDADPKPAPSAQSLRERIRALLGL